MEEVRVEERMEHIASLLAEKNYKQLKIELEDMYPVDIAEAFEDLNNDECILLFRLLQKDLAAEVFSYLSAQRRKDVVSGIHTDLLKHILDELYFDDKIDFLEEMPANFVKDLLKESTVEERKLINQFLHYPENSAGSLMTIEYVDLKRNMTVQQALKRIKEIGMEKETVYTCYVLDPTRRLIGIVSLRQLVLADENSLIEDIMDTEVVLAQTGDDQEEVAELFKKYDLMVIPVVDAEHRLIGIITIDDIVDVIEQENTEDFQKMAAISPSDEAYLDMSPVALTKKRIVWLMLLMISAMFTAKIITHFEELLSSAVALAAYIPMLMDTGGNSGSQTSTTVIRGMALGEVELSDWAKVLWKEARIGVMAGVLLAVVNFGRMMLLESGNLNVAITVSVTLICTVLLAKLIGGLLPIGARALKLDPAIMASPIITTVVDAIALAIYFSLASALVL